MIESVANSVDKLLDGEQRDKRTGNGDGRIERSDGRHRRHPEAREAAQEIDIAKVDETERNPEDHQSNDDLGDQARRSMQRFGDRREIQMIVAPRRHRGAGIGVLACLSRLLGQRREIQKLERELRAAGNRTLPPQA